MTYSTILFDLDGTLSNPARGIVNALVYALQKSSAPEINQEDLLKFIGPPLAESFKTFCGFNDEQTEQAIINYREYFSKNGLFENQLYVGISELLHTLKESGKQLGVATSKPEFYAKQIIDYFSISEYFDFIAGATMDGSRSKKSDVIAYAIETHCITKENTVMVGDRAFDVIGAKENGLNSIGVLYGFGNQKELEEAGATWLVDDIKSLEDKLMGN
ncbi:HAD family hydrolase [Lactococcus allomyrinae]|uniref:HAD family hydrolase n=1 Tax=Lactococcus allomyrinae TaxID=2419773 RepID=A0A387BH14_9LACT|nr:HAD family hydrolase [Lactococcus allomyrinae]AYG00160.1 HAD family hydrolase [Lactococcus allomyrinae]